MAPGVGLRGAMPVPVTAEAVVVAGAVPAGAMVPVERPEDGVAVGVVTDVAMVKGADAVRPATVM